MESELSDRWILAFDAGCCRCGAIAEKVQQSAGSRLETLSLLDSDVKSWRSQSLGDNPPWAPTLIHVAPHRIKAWVGIPMALRLERLIGVRATLRLLSDLGEMRKASKPQPDTSDAAAVGRGKFLRLAGLGVVAAIIGPRMSAAHAETGRLSPAQEWVKANRAALPQTYPEFAAHDLVHRRAIYVELPGDVRRQLWLDHFQVYRDTHPDLTREQHRVIDQAVQVHGAAVALPQRTTQIEADLDALKAAAIAAFGAQEAARLIATLGPAEDPSPSLLAGCGCSVESDFCVFSTCRGCWGCRTGSCSTGNCTCADSGCGNAWAYNCDGTCH